MPLKTTDAGAPCAKVTDPKTKDVIDEAIEMYRATIMFKTFQPKGPADRIVVFLTCFIQKVLEEIKECIRIKKTDKQRDEIVS